MSDFDIDALIFGTKVCPACGRELPANTEQFSPDKSGARELTSWCRRCRAAKERERYAKDPGPRKAAARRYAARKAAQA